ncbi:hypothetical protein [Bradyrhizobium australiense]|uniref:hypothetical protein n=1 Tax=Bradyrhizobium australiense TaxID=2721161 RepID=UPI001F40B641|nr:hypothetical protein [Bradyrhizobium australiense]
MHARGDEIFVLPDILCNAGGVIVSYFEWGFRISSDSFGSRRRYSIVSTEFLNGRSTNNSASKTRSKFQSNGCHSDRNRRGARGQAN